MFTTRPEILGTFGVVTSTHWLASSSGMAMLERGGNAFDAAVAAGFLLQVVQPHLVGPGGEVPIIFHSARTGRTEVLCGQGTAPAGATVEHYKREGMNLIPGNGLLSTVIPGSFDAWMLLLRDHGTLSVADVLEPAIYYAHCGHPLLPGVTSAISRLRDLFTNEWPTSGALFAPDGNVPSPGALFRNEALANTWRRIVKEAQSAGSDRQKQIEKARDAFYRGFVAEEIERFATGTDVMDMSGQRHRGVITADDMAGWQAHYEAPVTYDYHGYTLNKTGPWGQGPAFLQTLALLKSLDIGAMDPVGPEFVHTLTEAMKLAFADREFYYGDPEFVDVPMQVLLSDAYNSARAGLIGNKASRDLRPGKIDGYENQIAAMQAALDRLSAAEKSDAETIEPTMAAMRSTGRGDTVHLDAIDRHGNMVAAMPSGGWLQSSPLIPNLGFMLNSRAQMFWLEPGLPSTLAPRKRPRTTLTPSLAHKEGRPYMAFGTPGGDQQEQWQLQFFLRHVHHGLNMQQAIDLPMSHTAHAPSSFYPRGRKPAHLAIEESFGSETIATLKAWGHEIETAPAWTISSVIAAARDQDGLLRAAATPRLMQAYAVGR
jgi:gamma-glutamyltranspeptidase/glutathione hydrolase